MPRCRCRPPPPARRSARRARGERAPARAVAARDRSRQPPPCRAASRHHAAAQGRAIGIPAKALGAFAQAGDEVAARERPAGLGIDAGLVAYPQLDRVDAGGRRRARRSPTRARTSRGTRRAPASRTASARRARRGDGSCGGLEPRTACVSTTAVCSANSSTRRCLLDDVVGDRGQPTIARGSPGGGAGSSACGSPRARTSAAA